LLIKYIKSVLWRVAKCLSYIDEARCLKVKQLIPDFIWIALTSYFPRNTPFFLISTNSM